MLLLRPTTLALLALGAAAFIPSPTQQPAARTAAPEMSSMPMPATASAPVPNQAQAGRSSIFPPPLMSFYGEQRRRYVGVRVCVECVIDGLIGVMG